MIPGTFIRASRLASTSSTSILRTPLSLPSTNFYQSTTSSFLSPQLRFYAAPPPSKVVKKPTGPPRDEDIPYSSICLVDPINKTLLPPSLLNDLLISIDRKRYYIMMVDPSHEPPICKLMDKKVEFAKNRSPRATPSPPISTTTSSSTSEDPKASTSTTPPPLPPTTVRKKALSGPPKEVHVTWGVTAHDLGHKLGKAKEMLKKGYRVVVVINNKKDIEALDARSRAGVIESVVGVLEGYGKLVTPAVNKGNQVMMEFKGE